MESNEFILLTKKCSTMNTRKLIFGLLAIVMLVAASASSYIIDGQDTGVKRKHTMQKKK